MGVDISPRLAVEASLRRLFVYNGGFVGPSAQARRIRRILSLAGSPVRLGIPKPDRGDAVGVWGHSPTAHRGEAIAEKHNAPIIRVEDALLRSVHPGRDGSAPLGLMVDSRGAHFDPTQPSDLETLLATHPLDDSHLLSRARDAATELRRLHLSKYNAFDPKIAPPKPGYVLVIDQTRDDASVIKSGADQATFYEMLVFAQEEHPGARVIIKTHPETAGGHRGGYFTKDDETQRVKLLSDPVSPWALFEGALGVYTVSSGLGFEAIYAGHKPRVFGKPFYAGWGLTTDEFPVQRRQRILTRAQLFAAAMILYPKWYDPFRDELCELERVIDVLSAEARAWRDDHHGYVAKHMRLWKRGPLQKFYGADKKMIFADNNTIETAAEQDREVIVWAGKSDPKTEATALATGTPLARIEDGFIRSRGLGAALTPPMSLVKDDLGIYYDPTHASRLEAHILAAPALPDGALFRAEHLITRLMKNGASKYNLVGDALPDLPDGERLLVPGQVEDDASIKRGAGAINTNLGLLQDARARFPEATILYKPHPDVESGLRAGKIPTETAMKYADVVLDNISATDILPHVSGVMTMTSTLGFEALLRGIPVACLGAPFYAGWGLTTDLGNVPARRGIDVTLAQLVHAVLIDYPRYFDPVTGRPAPVEVILDRIETGKTGRQPTLRALSKLQGLMASYAHLWR